MISRVSGDSGTECHHKWGRYSGGEYSSPEQVVYLLGYLPPGSYFSPAQENVVAMQRIRSCLEPVLYRPRRHARRFGDHTNRPARSGRRPNGGPQLGVSSPTEGGGGLETLQRRLTGKLASSG